MYCCLRWSCAEGGGGGIVRQRWCWERGPGGWWVWGVCVWMGSGFAVLGAKIDGVGCEKGMEREKEYGRSTILYGSTVPIKK